MLEFVKMFVVVFLSFGFRGTTLIRHRMIEIYCRPNAQFSYCWEVFVVLYVWCQIEERKGKEEYLYSAFLQQTAHKVLRRGSHSFTCK